MPFRKIPGHFQKHETRWTPEMISFLKSNWETKTNQQLADALDLRLTVVRNKLSELGLKRTELEYWSEEMVDFLRKSYMVIGDVEIMNFLKVSYPKNKGWKRNAIWKKKNSARSNSNKGADT